MLYPTADSPPLFQALDELFMCDGEEFTNMSEADQKFYAGFLIDTTFIAAVQKKKWGAQQQTGYHILALSSDHGVIQRLSNSPTAAAPDTIDLSTASSAKKRSRNRKSGGNGKGKKRPKRRRINKARDTADPIGDDTNPEGNADSDDEDNSSDDNRSSDYTPDTAGDSDGSDDSSDASDDNDNEEDDDDNAGKESNGDSDPSSEDDE